MKEIPKAYNPIEVEDKWYSYWEKNNLFRSEIDNTKIPYTIVIPPPNITGSLTMGHILNNTIQDILIRMKRMQGFNACWVPGTDHASIATETKVTTYLKEQGINKHNLTREEFLKYCWEWKEKYGGIIIQQLKKLGVSCDWQRERFTLDSDYYNLVIETFVKLYDEGLIYRGKRLVNWCPASKSAISDEEVLMREINAKLYYFKYPVKDTDEYLVIATTRPETMLGDTAVAVNPHDKRYKKYIGKKIILPIVEREIPIIADYYVDMEFGTGAVKITPAHDFNDYEIYKRHNLEIINILNPDASLNINVPKDFQNLDRFDARKKVVEKLESLGLVEKIEDYVTNIGYSERGGVPIEPYLSEQWFLKMEEISKPALEVVLNGKIKFHPNHWVKTYEHWMNNIKDWCISRQLWWGHRIPVWYCVGDEKCNLECKQPIVSVEKPNKCPHCGSTNLRQDEDVLDTWASSWLWAYGVFKSEDERKYYYPTDTLVTAPDIIFFWVARMIITGLHFKNDIPFKDVYFTSVIRDLQGRKMSKSLGNSPDPLEVIKEYGADALRFTVIYLAPLGQDVLFSTDKCEIGRNFANKIWNAGRFLLMNKENISLDENLINEHKDFVDDWILSRLHSTIDEFNKAIEKFEINLASKIIYSFVWNDFCDWYIELSKIKLYSENKKIQSSALTRALIIFEQLLKLVHPFMPFISEELWQLISQRKNGESISISSFPKFNSSYFNEDAEFEMENLKQIVTSIRNIRGEMNIPPSKMITVLMNSESIPDYSLNYIKKLTRAEKINIDKNLSKPKASASAVLKNCEIFVPLEGLIDLDTERQRLQKEISRIENSLNGIEKKLSNPNFLNNAPKEIIEKEKSKQIDWQNNLTKLKELLNNIN
ncbi:MAG: valine--tRNA ligase [Ignavibacterium sp.]